MRRENVKGVSKVLNAAKFFKVQKVEFSSGISGLNSFVQNLKYVQS